MTSEAPPSYAQATGSSTSTAARPANGIPTSHRRSMEDEGRPLPSGWLRQFDAKSSHQFYVDTRCNPPRSIWHHPYDDDQYLRSLSSEERERIEELNRHPTRSDIITMSSSESLGSSSKKGGNSASAAAGAAIGADIGSSSDPYSSTSGYHAGPSGSNPPPKGLKKFGRNLKDKVTGTTHEQREKERREREIQEQREYEMHLRLREAMARAMETGQPQFLGKDQHGKDVYVEPPNYGGSSMYGGGGWGYNPYNQGPYTQTPHATYIRPPQSAYGRPYGYGYGGGMGLPIMGGLLGGALLGGLLF